MALSFSLLIGSASSAFAQPAGSYDDPLRPDIVPPPPLSASSPYGGSSRQGVYVLPGTKLGKDAQPRRLPPLPPREEYKPPRRSAPALPSPRLLNDPESVNPENHRAETPASLRYIRPSVQTRQPVYPKPQPLMREAQPLPDLQPQAPVQQAPEPALTPQAIPFGQPSMPPPHEPQVTIERAIPVEPQWQAPEPVQQPHPITQPQPGDVADEFESIISAPPPALQALPELVPQDAPPELPLAEDMIQSAPTETVEIAETPVLSEESRKIISATPSGIDTKKTAIRSPKPVIIKRTDPNAGLGPDVRTHEALGMKIEVRRADVNIQDYLEEGYENLLNGREAIAAGYYEEALKAMPKNEAALFGLATTYQRMGRRDEARELYGQLLAINPTHREGLNNFMALISREAPQEAIEELEKLETENPDFSPIPAQLGIVYNKVGNPRMAARKLARALNLSPDNLSYKYNLAITLDTLGQVEEASDLYLELIEAYNDGATLPGDVENIRNRIVFINRKG